MGVGRERLIPSLSPWAIERVMVSLTEVEISTEGKVGEEILSFALAMMNLQ